MPTLLQAHDFLTTFGHRTVLAHSKEEGTKGDAILQGYAKAGETQHAMESVKWGTDYLLKTFKVNTGANNITVVYQVCQHIA